MHRTARTRSRERGATAVLVAIFIIAVGAFLALVLNVGHALDNRAQLLAAADSAALAGAAYLEGTATGLAAARVKAQEFAQVHKVDKDAITIGANSGNASTGDVVMGCWNDLTTVANKGSAFTTYPDVAKCPTARDVNAVLVRNGQDGVGPHNSKMVTYFGGLIGSGDVSVRGEGIAVGGGPCESCAIPFVFATCQVVDSSNNLNCSSVLRFSDANIDSLGFSSLSSAATNPNSVISALCGGSYNGKNPCVGGCTDVSDLSGDINVQNGNDLNCNVANAFFDAGIIGTKVTVPILDIPCTGSPPNPQFNQPHPVVGFATMTLEAVCGDNAAKGSSKCSYANLDTSDIDPSTGLPYECPGGGRAVIIKLDCGETSNKRSGCKPMGTISPPRLVR